MNTPAIEVVVIENEVGNGVVNIAYEVVGFAVRF
jgi:adenosyl cobinamide kinase/adenosyl cobinamide phosphate guanylyltransferase